MAVTNMKTYVCSLIRPFVQALKVFYDNQVKVMFERIKAHDDSFLQLQAQVADLSALVIKLQTSMLTYEQEVRMLRNALFTAENVKQLSIRCNELSYICGTLFDLVYRFQITATMPDTQLPDFDYPILPTEKGLTDKELEIEFRNYRGIDLEVELSDDQKEDLAGYIAAYRAKYGSADTTEKPEESSE